MQHIEKHLQVEQGTFNWFISDSLSKPSPKLPVIAIVWFGQRLCELDAPKRKKLSPQQHTQIDRMGEVANATAHQTIEGTCLWTTVIRICDYDLWSWSWPALFSVPHVFFYKGILFHFPDRIVRARPNRDSTISRRLNGTKPIPKSDRSRIVRGLASFKEQHRVIKIRICSLNV